MYSIGSYVGPTGPQRMLYLRVSSVAFFPYYRQTRHGGTAVKSKSSLFTFVDARQWKLFRHLDLPHFFSI